MSFDLNFDATQVQPSEGRPDPVPAGWYVAMITESSLKPTADGQGQFAELVHTICEGQYSGRKIYTNHNIRNANPITEKIAYEQLSAIAHAAGVLHVANTSLIENIPMRVKAKIIPAKGEYDAKNDITTWKHMNEQVGGNATPAQPATPATPLAPPWAGAPPAAQPPAQQPAPQAQPQPAPQIQAPPATPTTTPPAAQPGQGWQGSAQPWAQNAQAPAQAPAPPEPAQAAQAPAAQPTQAQPPWVNNQPAPQAGAPATPPWQQPAQ